MRTVEIHVDEKFFDAVGDSIAKDVNAAFGYLATWAIQSDRHGGKGSKVGIHADKDGCVSATYRDANNEVTYSLFGLRGSDGTYSFHS